MHTLIYNLKAGVWTPSDFLSFLALAVFWAMENYFVQESAFVASPATKFPSICRFTRLVLDLTTAMVLLLLCRRWLLIGLLCADSLLSVLILAYSRYFRHAFSLYAGLKQLREGAQFTPFAIRFVPWPAGLMFLTLGLKISLAFCLAPMPAEVSNWGSRLADAGVCLVPAALIILLLQMTSFNFRRIPELGLSRAVYAYGYFLSWIAEYFVVPDTHELKQEMVQLQFDSPDRLSATESSWGFKGHVVVVQMESWGWNALNCKRNEQEVTPFLNQLAGKSRLFRVEAFHHVGSLDMDYAVLSGGRPSKHMISYLVPDIPYDHATPRFMQRHGYRTMALHGNSGEFFRRRANFQRMGFDQLYFQEDFCKGAVTRSYWGVRDVELFRLSAQKLRQASGPEFHFIITLDSHVPFDLISEVEKEMYPRSQSWQENYFNSLRVLDRSVCEYVKSLPAGTLVRRELRWVSIRRQRRSRIRAVPDSCVRRSEDGARTNERTRGAPEGFVHP
jgi:phosphoglycerol transferase MdoB-like AlkP superfamily enzyme